MMQGLSLMYRAVTFLYIQGDLTYGHYCRR